MYGGCFSKIEGAPAVQVVLTLNAKSGLGMQINFDLESEDPVYGLQVAIQEVRRLQRFGVTRSEMERYCMALLRDSEQAAEQVVLESIPGNVQEYMSNFVTVSTSGWHSHSYLVDHSISTYHSNQNVIRLYMTEGFVAYRRIRCHRQRPWTM